MVVRRANVNGSKDALRNFVIGRIIRHRKNPNGGGA
jgi:hypothetical protein